PSGREEVPWDIVAAVLSIARFCEPSSELHIADTWYERTSLDSMLGVIDDLVGKDRLYRCHGKILPHKDAIEKKLRERFETIFAGNRHDQTTLEEIVETMERKHGSISRVGRRPRDRQRSTGGS
ncbi:MAG: hypothetical protein NUW37_07220, partial [Planctomycetes bacterium]|nr:hypothetical protein [Planctomycetota bacterium]